MITVLIDVNVILDVLLDREPHVRASSAVWRAVETGEARGLLAAHGFTTIHYLVQRQSGTREARRMIVALRAVFDVAAVDQQVIDSALHIDAADFEDSVTAAAAKQAGCDLVVTRDPKGFRSSPVRAVRPESAVEIIRG